MAASNHPEISATELELKRRGRRRLIGAIALGLLAIVFLPMIFDREPRRSGQAMKTQNIEVQVPSKEGQAALPVPTAAPVVVATPPAAQTAVTEVLKEEAPPKTASVAPAPAKEVVKDAAKVAAKPDKPSKSAAAPSADKTGFVVQLGVFSDADNANQVIAKVKESGLAVYTEKIPIKSGNATRVRVGPYATRDKADAALAQVKLAGADGRIVPLN